VRLRPASAEFSGGGLSLTAVSVESTRFGGSASDRAWLFDSAGDDRLDGGPTFATLSGGGFSNSAFGCGSVTVVASAGRDTANLSDSAGVDRLDAGPLYAWLRGAGYSLYAGGFDDVVAQSSGGRDLAALVGSAGSDSFWASGSSRRLLAGGVLVHTDGFRTVAISGGGGIDQVELMTTNSQPRVRGRGDRGQFVDGSWTTDFAGIESVLASVRAAHQLESDLRAVDFLFRRIGRG
jgi:hypothetical protein